MEEQQQKSKLVNSRWREAECRLWYLYSLGGLQRLLWRNPHFSVSEQLLDEEGDVPPCDGDVLYTAANHVAFRLRQTDHTDQSVTGEAPESDRSLNNIT